jgi:hypothetical protein
MFVETTSGSASATREADEEGSVLILISRFPFILLKYAVFADRIATKRTMHNFGKRQYLLLFVGCEFD